MLSVENKFRILPEIRSHIEVFMRSTYGLGNTIIPIRAVIFEEMKH